MFILICDTTLVTRRGIWEVKKQIPFLNLTMVIDMERIKAGIDQRLTL